MPRPSALPILASCVVLFACSDASSRITSTAYDSAGIRVVINGSAQWNNDEAWTLSDTPSLDIGAVFGDANYEFSVVPGAFRLSDGRIVVANGGTKQIRFYDSAGTFIKAIGRSGQGPGEFESLYRLARLSGDTILALDPPSLTTVFDANGAFVRRFRLDPVAGRPNIWWIGALDHGLLAVSLTREGTRELNPPSPATQSTSSVGTAEEEAQLDVPDRPENYRDTLMHFMYTMAGRMRDSVIRLPGQWLSHNPAFKPNAAYGFQRNVMHHSPGDRIEIRSYEFEDVDGQPAARLTRIVRNAPLRNLRFTRKDRDDFETLLRVQARIDRIQNAERRIANMLETTVYADSMPAHGRAMFVDPDGNIWLGEYSIPTFGQYPATHANWMVFDSTGVYQGVVRTPPRFNVTDIGRDYVLGVWRGDDDVEHIRMFTIRKATTAAH